VRYSNRDSRSSWIWETLEAATVSSRITV